MGCHDRDDFRLWQHLPMSMWSDGALRSFCQGIPELEAAVDLAAPTAEAVQRVMEEVFGLRVVPTSTDIEPGDLH